MVESIYKLLPVILDASMTKLVNDLYYETLQLLSAPHQKLILALPILVDMCLSAHI